MKGPIVRCGGAHFARLTSGVQAFKKALFGPKQKDEEMVDINTVTRDEVKRHKEALRSIKKRTDDRDEVKQSGTKRSKPNSDTSSTRKPISFASL